MCVKVAAGKCVWGGGRRGGGVINFFVTCLGVRKQYLVRLGGVGRKNLLTRMKTHPT